MDNIKMTFESAICLQSELQSLLKAIEKGSNEEAKAYLSNIVNPSSLIVDSSKLTLLHYAAKCGNVEMVQHLIEQGCDVNALDNSNFTPLMFAVQNVNATTVEVLLRNNANVFTRKSSLQLAWNRAMNSFMVVREKQKYQAILEMLIEKVNNDFLLLEETNSKGFMKDHDLMDQFIVVVFGGLKLAKDTLDMGYPVDFQELAKGCTALHCAMIFAKAENVKLLMNYEVNIFKVNNVGFSPLHYYPFHFEPVDKDSSILKSFLKSSVDFYLPDKNGLIEVEYLLKYGEMRTRKVILDEGLRMLIDEHYKTSNFEYLDRTKIADLLLQYGFDAQRKSYNYIKKHFIELMYEINEISVLNVFLAHLALLGEFNLLTDFTRDTIENNPKFKACFDEYTQTIESMKSQVVYEKVTLFKLLTESEKNLVGYARNQALRSKFKDMIKTTPLDSDSHYSRLLRKRLENALERMEFEKKFVPIIQLLTGLDADVYHVIVYKIIGYLDIQDLNNLCRVESMLLAAE